MAKRLQKLTKNAPKSPKLADTDGKDPDDEEEEKVPVAKKVPKSPGLAKTDQENSGDSETEDTLQTMSFFIDKSLELDKNEEESVLIEESYRGGKISYVAKFDINYL